MVFEHDNGKPYEFIWFLIAAGDAGFLPPPVVFWFLPKLLFPFSSF